MDNEGSERLTVNTEETNVAREVEEDRGSQALGNMSSRELQMSNMWNFVCGSRRIWFIQRKPLCGLRVTPQIHFL